MDAAWDDDLQHELEGDEPEWSDPEWVPPDERRVTGMLYRLGRVRAELDADRARARMQIDQVRAWLERREQSALAQDAYLCAALGRYHQAVLRMNPKALSIPLGPAGTLTSRMSQAEWSYVDEAAFLEWAKANLPGAVRQKPPPPPEIDRNAAKDLLTRRDEKGKPLRFGVTADGEPAPGLVVKEPERTFDVKLTTPTETTETADTEAETA